MPRNWRCTNGHAWTGELGALTFCPECGSADVYEVRGPLQPSATPSDQGLGTPDGGATFIQTAAPRRGAPTSIGDTFVQGYSQAGRAANLPDDCTFIQPALSGGDTFVQAAAANSGTTQVQVPATGDGGDTIHQTVAHSSPDGTGAVDAGPTPG